jgi:hypothetical protein
VPQGQPATRLGCDPEVARLIIAGAGTPDAAYAVVETTNSWQIAAITPNPP